MADMDLPEEENPEEDQAEEQFRGGEYDTIDDAFTGMVCRVLSIWLSVIALHENFWQI